MSSAIRRRSAPPRSSSKEGTTRKDSDCSAASLDDSEEVIFTDDVGFAKLVLRRIAATLSIELLIEAREVQWQDSEIDRLLEFLNRCLTCDAAASGFGITYDFRLLQNPSVRILRDIARWGSEPSRLEIFKTRCKACKTCVPPGWKFWATKAAMKAFFVITPPTCKTYLMTSFEHDCENVACFEPPDEPMAATLSTASSKPHTSEITEKTSASYCCRRRSKQETPDQRRIRKLEGLVEELLQQQEENSKRTAMLEDAVPWKSTVEQVNSSKAKLDEFFQSFVCKANV